MNKSSGFMVAFSGISGTGKSTCARKIQEITSWSVFVEPEESTWPSVLKENREQSTIGFFSGFRNLRVPVLFEAAYQREQGRIALVDSYFDKVTGLYIQKEGMEWLLPQNDPYRDEIVSIAKKDYKLLPNADVVVMFNAPRLVWEKRMLSRGREIDKILANNGYYTMQDNVRQSLETWSKETGCVVLDYKQIYKNVEDVAKDVIEMIESVPRFPQCRKNFARKKSTL